MKVKFYLPHSLIEKVNLETVMGGSKIYSNTYELYFNRAFKEFIGLKSRSTFDARFTSIMKDFVPSKRGRPWHKENHEKREQVSIYLSLTTANNLSWYSELYDFSKSDMAELSIRIADSLFSSKLPIKRNLDEKEILLLQKISTDIGCKDVSEFLSLLQNENIFKIVRKGVQELKIIKSNKIDQFKYFLKKYPKIHSQIIDDKLVFYNYEGHPRKKNVFYTSPNWESAAGDPKLKEIIKNVSS